MPKSEKKILVLYPNDAPLAIEAIKQYMAELKEKIKRQGYTAEILTTEYSYLSRTDAQAAFNRLSSGFNGPITLFIASAAEIDYNSHFLKLKLFIGHPKLSLWKPKYDPESPGWDSLTHEEQDEGQGIYMPDDEPLHDCLNSIISDANHQGPIEVPVFSCLSGLAYNSRRYLPSNVRLFTACSELEFITNKHIVYALLRIADRPSSVDPWALKQVRIVWTSYPWADIDQQRQSWNPSEFTCGPHG